MYRDLFGNDLTDVVKTILLGIPGTRDNDHLLFLEVLKRTGINPDTMTLSTYLLKPPDSVVDFESVRRTRQRVQQFHPLTRGKRYEERIRRSQFIRESSRKVPHDATTGEKDPSPDPPGVPGDGSEGNREGDPSHR